MKDKLKLIGIMGLVAGSAVYIVRLIQEWFFGMESIEPTLFTMYAAFFITMFGLVIINKKDE